MEKAPAFQFYPKDFLVDTAVCPPLVCGAYIRLLCFAWSGVAGLEQGELPDDPVQLARLAGLDVIQWSEISDDVRHFFQSKDGILIHAGLKQELQKQEDRRKKCSIAGLKSVSVRSGKTYVQPKAVEHVLTDVQPNVNTESTVSSTDVQQEVEQEVNSSSSSSSSSSGNTFPDKVLELYHLVCVALPKVKVATRIRKRIVSRVREDKTRSTLAWWKMYFDSVVASDFLYGRKTDWRANLDWLTGPENMLKVLNGSYTNQRKQVDSKPKVTADMLNEM